MRASAARDGDERAIRPPTVSLSLAPLAVSLEVGLVGSDRGDVLAAACRHWHGVADASTSGLSLRVEVSRALDGVEPGEIVLSGSRLEVRGGSAAGKADASTRQAVCSVSADLFALPERLRAELLEPLVLFLLARCGRAPIHASGFLAGDLAVLLSGPSGSGKSCLALAADAAGYAVMSEDMIHVQRDPCLRVWGWPGPAHLLPADAANGRGHPERLRGGRVKYAVPLRSATAGMAVSADRAALCLLERGDRLSLDRLSADEAMQRLERLEAGFELSATVVREAQAALTRNGAWRLTLSADPYEAIRFLAEGLDRLRETAVP